MFLFQFHPISNATLAFISEFNVQMMYLPGLKNVVADYLSPPSWTGGAIPVSTAAVPVLSAVNATEVGPLTSSPAGRRQSLGGSPVETGLRLWLAVKLVGNNSLIL